MQNPHVYKKKLPKLLSYLRRKLNIPIEEDMQMQIKTKRKKLRKKRGQRNIESAAQVPLSLPVSLPLSACLCFSLPLPAAPSPSRCGSLPTSLLCAGHLRWAARVGSAEDEGSAPRAGPIQLARAVRAWDTRDRLGELADLTLERKPRSHEIVTESRSG